MFCLNTLFKQPIIFYDSTWNHFFQLIIKWHIEQDPNGGGNKWHVKREQSNLFQLGRETTISVISIKQVKMGVVKLEWKSEMSQFKNSKVNKQSDKIQDIFLKVDGWYKQVEECNNLTT